MKTNIFRPLVMLIGLLGIALLVPSCSKEQQDKLKEEIPNETSTVPFYRLQRVENFKGDTTDTDPMGDKPLLLFSLEQKKIIEVKFQKTTAWDVAFSDLYNLYMSGNFGNEVLNFGAGSSGKGGIMILDQAFDDVVDVPADDKFIIKRSMVGLDAEGDFGSGIGWLLYDFGGKKMRDGAYDNQHIAYAMGSPIPRADGTFTRPRTIIVRTAKGNYAKVKMISVYKNAYTHDKWFRNTAHMFFSFEYVMVPKGSSKFEIK